MKILLDHFNTEMSNSHISDFCALYDLKNFINEPAHYKNADKPTSIDHILTNHLRCFRHSGLSDIHKVTSTVLKTFYAKHSEITKISRTPIIGGTCQESDIQRRF